MRVDDASIRAKLERQQEAIAQHNPVINALICPPGHEQLQARVQTLVKRPQGLLHGLTVSLKDNIDTNFAPTTAGARFWKQRQPVQNAVVVNRLLQAGAIAMGKASMTELAWGVSGYSALGGQCRHPLDHRRIAGGSSGGSAASVAAGFCDASLGTDTGGSVRIPAAFCGLLGLRPTFGGISNHGVLPLSHSHDTVGILAQEVVDVARLYTAIAGPCAQDPTSNGQPASNVLARLHQGVEGLRLGIPTHYYFDYCAPEVCEAVMAGATLLAQQGATLVQLQVEGAEQAQEMAMCMMASEVTARYAKRLTTEPETISTPIRERMMQAFSYTGLDYAQAVEFKQRWQWQLRQQFRNIDVMLMPTTTCTAPLIGSNENLLEATRDVARNTYLSAMAGIPSLSVPCGSDAHGLPIGMMLESAWGREDLLLRVANVLMATLPSEL